MNELLESLVNRRIYSVSELNTAARDLLEAQFKQIWVEGEISNFSSPGSGHWYFSLKDSGAQIRCAMFRNRNKALKFRPKQGDKFIARGQISLYPARGDYQLIVENLADAGAGAQQRAFEALKAELEAKGWFDESSKQDLPKAAKHIAVISSETGAVWHDIQTTVARRYPFATLSLLPVSVQGESAPANICAAFKEIAAYTQTAKPPLDAVILARGGGSSEDLQAFNESSVAEAIYECAIPVVAAIGHETDFTIADFVADKRAATPTAAAELLTPDNQVVLEQLDELEQRMANAWGRLFSALAQNLDRTAARLQHPTQKLNNQTVHVHQLTRRLALASQNTLNRFALRSQNTDNKLHSSSPSRRVEKLQQRLEAATENLHESTERLLSRNKQNISVAVSKLDIASPLATLARGYAIASDAQGNTITKAASSKPGDDINLTFVDGTITATVKK